MQVQNSSFGQTSTPHLNAVPSSSRQHVSVNAFPPSFDLPSTSRQSQLARKQPDFHFKESDFPALAGVSGGPSFFRTVPNTSKNAENPSQTVGLTVTQIIKLISEIFQLTPAWTDILLKLIPVLNILLKKLISSWPLLGLLVSIDG